MASMATDIMNPSTLSKASKEIDYFSYDNLFVFRLSLDPVLLIAHCKTPSLYPNHITPIWIPSSPNRTYWRIRTCFFFIISKVMMFVNDYLAGNFPFSLSLDLLRTTVQHPAFADLLIP